jgi:hypothetical protein
MVNKFPFSFFVVNLIFFTADKMMYACLNCCYIVMGTSSCHFAMLLLLLKYLEIFLGSQPSPMLSVIPLIAGIFSSEN